MIRLYLVRHCESTMQGAYCGRRSDPDLSSVGQAQAVLLGQAFRAVPIVGVFSSSQLRARRTAEEITRLHELTVAEDDRFDEMDFGDWDGLTHDEISTRRPEEYDRWLADPLSRRPPNGESVPELLERTSSGFTDTLRAVREGEGRSVEPIEPREPKEPSRVRRTAKHASFQSRGGASGVVVVSHGGPLRLWLAATLRLPLAEYWRLRIDPGSITALDVFDEEASVLVYSNRDAAAGIGEER